MRFLVVVSLGIASLVQCQAQIVQIGLSPPAKPQAKLTALVEGLDARRHRVENSASVALQKAFSHALADGKAAIDSAVSSAMSSSFLGGVRVKVMSTPGVDERLVSAVEKFETSREDSEEKLLTQAAAELGQITSVVVKELKRSLAELRGQSFVEIPGETSNLGNVDVEVKAGKAAFPTVLSLVEAMEHHRDMSENSLNMQVLDMQTSLVKALNAEIVAALRKYK